MAEWYEEFGEAAGDAAKNEAYWRKKLGNQGSISNPAPRSNWRRFMDSAEDMIKHYSPAAAGARAVQRVIPLDQAWLEQEFGKKGADQRQAARRKKVTADERDWRQVRAGYDPADSVTDHVVDFAGGMAGGMISDPTNLVAPGGTLARKAVGAAAVGGASDVALQGAEMWEGVRDEINPTQVAVSTAAGPALIGATAGAKKIMPVVGRISSGYGQRRAPRAGASTNHLALDIDAPEGTIVQSPGIGTVSKVGRGHAKRGNWVEIDHGGGVTSRYLHLQGFNVKPGDQLNPGQLFGKVGKTGNVTGAHLHWSVMKDGKPVDPRSIDFNLADVPPRAAHPMSPDEIARIVKDEEAGRINADEEALLARADDDNVVSLRNNNERVYDQNQFINKLKEVDKAYDEGRISSEEYDRVLAAAERNDLNAFEFEPKIDPLTTAERQDMDASAPKPENTNTGILGKIGGVVKDIIADNDGAFRPFGRKPEEPEVPVPESVRKLTLALEDAKPLSKEQRGLYSEARREKLAKVGQVKQTGEARHYAQLNRLKGALPKVEYESIRSRFGQDEIDELFDLVAKHPTMNLYDKVNADGGLVKMLGGTVPTKNEIDLLSKVFPKELIDNIGKNRPFMAKFWEATGNILNIPRSIMSSFDLSAPLRQGVFMVGKKEFYSSFFNMFKMFGSEKAYKAVMDDIQKRPSYRLMEEGGLSLTEMGRNLTNREEAFISDWAGKIPVLGIGIRASNRAYIGFLNKLRADVFDDLMQKGNDVGIDFRKDDKALKDLSRFINNATGRGDLGKLNQAAPVLSGLFFSPRLMASRLNMLNPTFYATLDPFVRKEAVKSLLTFAGIATTVLTLAAAGGMNVETDPRSADFAKIKKGNTRADILGGFQQYIRLASQLITGETKTINGKVKPLGEGYKSDSRYDIILRFLRTKFSPVASYAVDAADGENVIGEEFKPGQDAMERFIPMFAQDLTDALSEYGPAGAMLAPPMMFGVGVSTYKPKEEKAKPTDWTAEFKADESKSKSKENEWWSDFE